MKNIRIIFEIIRKYCYETGISNEQCFTELERSAVNNSMFFPVYSYLRVLQSLGLIKLSKFKKALRLTDKGKAVGSLPVFSLPVFIVLFLHVLRRVLVIVFLFILCWPLFLAIPKQYNAQRDNAG